MTVKELALQYEDSLIALRRHFHEHPELAFEEFETSKKIQSELDAIGVPYRVLGGETGILATIEGAKPGKTILLRGDIDALPVSEETGASYASKNDGKMHACGHDCHASMLLTAAKILNDMRGELAGTVRLLFQPAEEGGGGAVRVVADGAMDGVDACFAIHVWSEIAAGEVSVEAGPRMASAGMFTVTVHGAASHGAAPHQGVDAALVGSTIHVNLQSIVSRETSPMDSVVVTVGTVNAGTGFNIIAETATLTGTTRTFSQDVYDAFPEMMQRITSDTAAAFRATADLDYKSIAAPVINDEAISAIAQTAAAKVMGAAANIRFAPTMVGEDFSVYMNLAPGALALLGVRNEEIDACYPHHHSKFAVDESALKNGAALYAQVALDFLASGE